MTCEWCSGEAVPPTRLCFDCHVRVKTEELWVRLQRHLAKFAESYVVTRKMTLETAEEKNELDAAIKTEAFRWCNDRGQPARPVN